MTPNNINAAHRADPFTEIELVPHNAVRSDAADAAAPDNGQQRAFRRRALGLGALGLLLSAAGIAIPVAVTRHRRPAAPPATPPASNPAAPRPSRAFLPPAPAPEPSLALTPSPAISAPVPAPAPVPSASLPPSIPAPAPAPPPTLVQGPPPAAATEPFAPQSGAFRFTPFAAPASGGQIVTGESMTLVVSTQNNACGQPQNAASSLVLQLARPRMGALTAGTYAAVANVAAATDMANVNAASLPTLTGYAGVQSAYGTPMTTSDLSVTLESVNHAGGNSTGTLTLTLANGQHVRSAFNAATCSNLYSGQ